MATSIEPLWRVWDFASAFVTKGQSVPPSTRLITSPTKEDFPFATCLVLDNGVLDFGNWEEIQSNLPRIMASEYSFVVMHRRPTIGVKVVFNSNGTHVLDRNLGILSDGTLSTNAMRINTGVPNFFKKNRTTRRVSFPLR